MDKTHQRQTFQPDFERRTKQQLQPHFYRYCTVARERHDVQLSGKVRLRQDDGHRFRGEQSGLLVPKSSVTNGDLARIGFGQTIAVTALQLCMATAAAVNGGYLLQPYLVKEISDPTTGKVVKRFSPTVVDRPISEQTSSQIAAMLQRVVAEGGGKTQILPAIVWRKTGTAQSLSTDRWQKASMFPPSWDFPCKSAQVSVHDDCGRTTGAKLRLYRGGAVCGADFPRNN